MTKPTEVPQQTEPRKPRNVAVRTDLKAGYGAGHNGQSANLVVHAVVGGLPFEIINSPY